MTTLNSLHIVFCSGVSMTEESIHSLRRVVSSKWSMPLKPSRCEPNSSNVALDQGALIRVSTDQLAILHTAWFDGSGIEDQGGGGIGCGEANYLCFIGTSAISLILPLLNLQYWSAMWSLTCWVIVNLGIVGTDQCWEDHGNWWAYWMCYEWPHCRCSNSCWTCSGPNSGDCSWLRRKGLYRLHFVTSSMQWPWSCCAEPQILLQWTHECGVYYTSLVWSSSTLWGRRWGVYGNRQLVFCFFEIHEIVVLMLDKWSSLMFRYSWIVSQYLYRYVLLWMCTPNIVLLFLLLQSRPFGVSLLIAGHDDSGPCL